MLLCLQKHIGPFEFVCSTCFFAQLIVCKSAPDMKVRTLWRDIDMYMYDRSRSLNYSFEVRAYSESSNPHPNRDH